MSDDPKLQLRHVLRNIFYRNMPSHVAASVCRDIADKILTAVSSDTAEALTTLDRMRAAGWSVAVHNDYRIDGQNFTFWLFTHDSGRFVKGEGRTDAEALALCEAASGMGNQP